MLTCNLIQLVAHDAKTTFYFACTCLLLSVRGSKKFAFFSMQLKLFSVETAGIGWKSWKKRWFILTRTSLVFFKNDPVSIYYLLDLNYANWVQFLSASLIFALVSLYLITSELCSGNKCTHLKNFFHTYIHTHSLAGKAEEVRMSYFCSSAKSML